MQRRSAERGGKFALLCIAAPAIFAAKPVFWSLPPTFLRGAGAAAGIAAINSIGNLGGFIVQTVVPAIKQATGSDILPMLFPAPIAAALVFVVLPQLSRGACSRCRGLMARPQRAFASTRSIADLPRSRSEPVRSFGEVADAPAADFHFQPESRLSIGR